MLITSRRRQCVSGDRAFEKGANFDIVSTFPYGGYLMLATL